MELLLHEESFQVGRRSKEVPDPNDQCRSEQWYQKFSKAPDAPSESDPKSAHLTSS
ncbi:hypothetical protein D3C87_1995220 [compost metagenome]